MKIETMIFLLVIAFCYCARVVYDSDSEHTVEIKVDSDKIKPASEYKKMLIKKLKWAKKAAKMKFKDKLLYHFVPDEDGSNYRFKWDPASFKEKMKAIKEGADSDSDDETGVTLTEGTIRLPKFIKGNVRDFSYREYYEAGDTYKVEQESVNDPSAASVGETLDFGFNLR